MTYTSTNNQGGRWDHQIVRGTSWGEHTITVRDSNGVVDLTGCTLYTHIMRDEVVVADVTATITDAANGVITTSMTAVETLTLPKVNSLLVVGFVDANDRVIELVRGKITTYAGPKTP